MKINKFLIGSGEKSKRVLTSYNFEVFDFTFLYNDDVINHGGFEYFIEPDFIKQLDLIKGRKNIDKYFISKIIGNECLNEVKTLNLCHELPKFNNNTLTILELQGYNSTGSAYYRETKIFELQKVYDLFLELSKYKNEDLMLFDFLNSQWEFLKEQKAIKNNMNYHMIDNNSLEHFINILSKTKTA